MKDIHAEHMPRSKGELDAIGDDLRAQVEQVLTDWSDDNWLQFSMWHLYQIKAYLERALAA